MLLPAPTSCTRRAGAGAPRPKPPGAAARRPQPRRRRQSLQPRAAAALLAPTHPPPNPGATSLRAVPQQQQQQQRAATEAGTPAPAAGACPFLAALSPPGAAVPWHRRLQQLLDPAAFQEALLAQHPDAAVVRTPAQLGLPEMFVPRTGPLIRQVLEGEGDTSLKAHNFSQALGPLLGPHALSVVQDPRHKYLRGLMQPAFTPDATAKLTPLLVGVIGGALARLAAEGRAVSGHEAFNGITFDVILKVVFGRDLPRGLVASMGRAYRAWGDGAASWPPVNLPWTSYGRAMGARVELLDMFQPLLDAARRELDAGQPAQGGLLYSLLSARDDQGNALSDPELKDNLLVLLLAGHATTQTSLTQLVVRLQEHPEVVVKLRQEQQEVVRRHGDELTAAALKDSVYADAVIRETLRLDPVLHGINRVAARDFALGGYAVPRGAQLMLPLSYASRRDPRWAAPGPDGGAPDAAAFNPDRMLGPEGSRPGWVMPFGHGSRYCLGAPLALAEMRVFLALLARHYAFSAELGGGFERRVGRVPRNGLPVTFTRLAAAG